MRDGTELRGEFGAVSRHLLRCANRGESRADFFREACDFGELIDLDSPDNLEGTSLVPLLIDPSRPWKKAAFTEWGDTGERRSMRTNRYRYNEQLYGGQLIVELYDHQTDPAETVNLADDPTHQATRRELAELLHAGWKAALPPQPRSE